MWDKLSIKDKAEIIKMGVANGIRDLDTIRDTYNNIYAEGGDTNNKNFISELDWSPEGWLGLRVPKPDGTKYTDEDIKSLNSHIPEYNLIEKESKENGTWLKMQDGLTWEGDPRSWIMMQSKAFKENYDSKPWYTGQAEWTTKFDYGNGKIDTNKVTRAPYYNDQMWFSDNKLYGDTFANYIDSTQRGWRFDDEQEASIKGVNFLSAIPKTGNYRYLEPPKNNTHDYWEKMPYKLVNNTIQRLNDEEIYTKPYKNIDDTNLRKDKQKVLTDDVANWSKDLNDDGIFMYNVDDGPVIDNGYINNTTVNEFISQPGFTNKIKFIEGNNGDFDINNSYKYSYNDSFSKERNYAANGGLLFMYHNPYLYERRKKGDTNIFAEGGISNFRSILNSYNTQNK